MLRITIPSREFYDETTNTFVDSQSYNLQLEHSLVSISKWEAEWKKPFLSKEEKTHDEIVDYIRCMTLTQNVDPLVYTNLSRQNNEEVRAYIEAPMTATTFSKNDKQVTKTEIITAEIIYYWMIALNIPFECQKWHLNRLLTLINVCNLKNQPPKKMGKKELLERNRSLNAARRSQLKTPG